METQPPRFPLPAFAPLCKSMVIQLIYHRVATRSALEAIRRYPMAEEQLLQEVAVLRAQVYAEMAPLVEAGRLTTHAFVDLLRTASPATSKPTEQLVSFWRSRGILRMDRHGYPDPHRAAAILIARRATPRVQRGWLPAEIQPREPHWLCWRQDEPDGPVQVAPFPLPRDLPAPALIWTVWPGARWLPHWVAVDGGAVYVSDGVDMATLERVFAVWQQPLDDDVRTALRVLENSEARHTFTREVLIRAMSPLAIERLQLQKGHGRAEAENGAQSRYGA